MVSIKEKDIRLIFKMKEVDIVELSKKKLPFPDTKSNHKLPKNERY